MHVPKPWHVSLTLSGLQTRPLSVPTALLCARVSDASAGAVASPCDSRLPDLGPEVLLPQWLSSAFKHNFLDPPPPIFSIYS